MEEKDIILNELESLGIKISPEIEAEYETGKKYKKLSKEQFESINNLMKAIPQTITQLNNQDVYKVIFDKGLGTLQRASKEYPGYFRGNIVEFGTNNRIKGQVLIKSLDKSLQLVSATFTVMSIITGQYYMSQINKEIKSINNKLSKIQNFLSIDKKSNLLSEEEFLNQVQSNLDSILEDNSYRIATLTTTQKIVIDSFAGVNFYYNYINNIKLNKEKDSIEEIIENIQEISENISNYLYSLYLYSFATYLEVILSQNLNENYIKYMMDKLEKSYIDFEKNSKIWFKKLDEYLKLANSFAPNKILEVLKYSKNVNPFFIEGKIISYLSEYYQEKKMEEKEKIKTEYSSLIKDVFSQNIDFIKCKRDNLKLHNILYNRPVEVIKYKDEMYLKIEEK